MADIDNPSGISPLRSTERVTAAKPVQGPNKRRDDPADFSFEDKVEIATPAETPPALEEIDLSVAMIRALINKELPPETTEALMNFAPLGDLSDALIWCDRIDQKQIEFVTWSNKETLAQALVRAAN